MYNEVYWSNNFVPNLIVYKLPNNRKKKYYLSTNVFRSSSSIWMLINIKSNCAGKCSIELFIILSYLKSRAFKQNGERSEISFEFTNLELFKFDKEDW